MNLGRGQSRFTFTDVSVGKETRELYQPSYMRRFPQAFIRVEEKDELTRDHRIKYWMPRWSDMTLCAEPNTPPYPLLEGLLLLKNELWSHKIQDGVIDGSYFKDDLNTRMREIIFVNQLKIDESYILEVVDSLPYITTSRHIHGDPTLANLLYNERSGDVRWIDPLMRSYIPNDPLVDLGKMFQSCWQYESVIRGLVEYPRFFKTFAQQLAELAELSFADAQKWCVIHLVRLLPYQDERVRSIYENVICATSLTWTGR